MNIMEEYLVWWKQQPLIPYKDKEQISEEAFLAGIEVGKKLQKEKNKQAKREKNERKSKR